MEENLEENKTERGKTQASSLVVAVAHQGKQKASASRKRASQETRPQFGALFSKQYHFPHFHPSNSSF